MLRNLIKPLVVAALFIFPISTFAAIDVNKSFSPGTLYPTEISQLTVTLLNSSLSPALDTSMMDEFPAEVFLANPINMVNTCGGIVNAVNSSTEGALTLSGGTIPGGDGVNPGECSITVDVLAKSKGTFVNTIEIGDVSGTVSGVSESNTQITQGTLVAVLSDVTISQGVHLTSPTGVLSHLQGGESGYWALEISNPNSVALSGVEFTDVLPTGWGLIAGSESTTCGGGNVNISSGNTITLTDGTIPANDSCYIAVEFKGNGDRTLPYYRYRANFTVPIGVISSREGAINSNSDTKRLDILYGVRFDKIFLDVNSAQHSIDVNVATTTQVRLRWRNHNMDAITPFSFSESMPAGMSIVSIDTNSCGGSVSITNGGSGISITGASVLGNSDDLVNVQNKNCEIKYTVEVTGEGTYDTSVPAGNIGGYAFEEQISSLEVTDNGFAIELDFSTYRIYQGDTINATITLINQSSASDITNISLSNDFSDLGVDNGFVDTDPLFKVSSQYTPAYTDCNGGILTAIDGTTAISFSGGALPAGESCTIVVEMKVDTDAISPPYDYNYAGHHNDIIFGGDITYTVNGINKTFATDVVGGATFRVFRSVVLGKEWTPSSVGSGGESRLKIEIRKDSLDQNGYFNMSLTDNLPSGFQVSSNPDVVNGCGGSISANPGDTSVILTGGELSANTGTQVYCYIYVNIKAPALTTPGVGESHRNRIPGDVHGSPVYFSAEDTDGNPWENQNYNADAVIVIEPINLNINTEFLTTSINGGGKARVRTTISNNDSTAVNITNVTLTDVFPTGVQLYSDINPVFTDASGGVTGACRGGIFTGNTGDGDIYLSSAEIDAGATCYVEYNVTAISGGNHINTIEIGDINSTQGVSNGNAAAATLTVGRNLNVGKGFSPRIIEDGGGSVLTISIYNSQSIGNDEVGSSGAQSALRDTLPAGMTIIGTPTTSCVGGTVIKGISGGLEYIELDGGEFDAESRCDIVANVEVTSGVGVYTNTIGKNDLSTVSGSKNSDDTSADLIVIEKPSITKVFSPSSIASGATTTLTFTLTNPNSTTLLDGVSFSDIMTDMQIASPLNVGGTCDNVSYTASVGGSSFIVNDAVIPLGADCTITVGVTSGIGGSHPNQATGLDSNQTQTTGSGSNIAVLKVLAPATMSKTFSPASVVKGQVSRLTFIITNPNDEQVNDIVFSDIFPIGMKIAAIPNISENCLGGAAFTNIVGQSLTGGEGSFRANGGLNIAANSSCEISLDVVATLAGTLVNNSSALTTNGGNSGSGATATLIVTTGDIPVITITGSGVLSHEVGTSYTDAGSTANDTEDGDLTSSVTSSGSVNTGVLGTYTITYDVTDSSGNVASQVTRTVEVVDTTSPVITASGSLSVQLYVNDSYTDAGGLCSDNYDSTCVVTSSGSVDTSTPGVYTITYNVSDSSGNPATQVTRTVEVITGDTPVITITGSGVLSHEVGTSYVDAGSTANDTEDGDLTSSVTSSGSVNTGVLGTYTITYDVTDSSGNVASQVTRTVEVVDTTSPVITASGSLSVQLYVNDSYTDAGGLCSDNYDSTCVVTSSGSVDTSTPGVYTITYNVSDSSGNPATQVTRTVEVITGDTPVITITGSGVLSHEVGTSYTDAGSTANDTEDGDLTSSVTSSGSVNTGVLGTYTITYDVTDSSGNVASQVTRTVEVVDTTSPVITASGSLSVQLYVNDSYTDAGGLCSDNYDSTCVVTSSGSVDTSTPGVYTITYNVSDSSGNPATQVTRTVEVITGDTPVITITGSGVLSHEVGTSYVDAGSTANDTEDGDLTSSVTSSGSVNTGVLGTYTITYDVTDSSGNVASQVTRTVEVVDTTSPVITASGSLSVQLYVNDSYTDAGGLCSDNYDSTCVVTSSGSVDTSTPGVYTITYNVSDSSGNPATQVTRTVEVITGDTPVITITGSGVLSHEVGTSYVDAGSTANDTEDGDLTSSVTSSGSVNTGVLGTYTITYDVTDSSGNVASQVTRTVEVVDTTSPVITASGSLSVQLYVNDSYTDAGALCSDNYDSTCVVTSSGSVDTSTPGVYTITYNVSDSSGNPATQVTRTVEVIDNNTDEDSDGDGISNRIEIIIGTDPNNTDTDGDGEDDSNNDLDNIHPVIELGAPNNGDGNADGGLDAIQNHVSSLRNIENTQYNSLEIENESTCAQIHYFASTSESELEIQDNNFDYALGLWDFEIRCSNPGSTANIQVYLDKVYDTSEWVYRKYDESQEQYSDISDIISYTIEDIGNTPVTVINYSVTDGGEYDEDKLENGVIIDPSGPAIQQQSGGASGSVKYDRCEGDDTSGSIYDGECGEEESVQEIFELEVAPEIEVVKGKDYEIENDFQSCPIIRDINDETYLYQTTGVFSDISIARFEHKILKFAEIGIVDGYDDGGFKPYQEMTRTEFLKVALISHCYEYHDMDPSDLIYTDIDMSSWQAKVIKKAQSLGMIHGDYQQDGTPIFRPNDIITKAEAVKILMRISLIQANEIEDLGYSDIIIEWHEKYIQNGEALGLFNSDIDEGIFHPELGVMRQDMVDLIDRLVHLY